MPDFVGGVALVGHWVFPPQLPEEKASPGQFADEFVEQRVIGMPAGVHAQEGHHVGGLAPVVGEQGSDVLVEEDQAGTLRRVSVGCRSTSSGCSRARRERRNSPNAVCRSMPTSMARHRRASLVLPDPGWRRPGSISALGSHRRQAESPGRKTSSSTDGRTTVVQTFGATALVTGANRGIGRAIVEALLTRGARKVYATARRLETLTGLAADPRARPSGPRWPT